MYFHFLIFVVDLSLECFKQIHAVLEEFATEGLQNDRVCQLDFSTDKLLFEIKEKHATHQYSHH